MNGVNVYCGLIVYEVVVDVFFMKYVFFVDKF